VTRDDRRNGAVGAGESARSDFEAVLHEPASTLCFVCGPSSLVSESAATLRELGVPDALIRSDRWEGYGITCNASFTSVTPSMRWASASA
jgi:hypothetical protein